MSLATLPIELLDEIFDNIERDLKLPLQHPFQTFPLPTGELIFQNSDINRVFTSLALTCQRLATVVRPRIYRDVEFAQNTSKATAFFTTIKQNPTYGQFVRTLRATRMFQSAYDEYVGFKGDWYEPRAIWPQLLGHLRSLKELTVATNPVDGVIFPLINTKIDIPARQSIEKLVLEDGLHLNAIFGIFSLPRLHHLDFVYSGPYHKFSPRELSQLPGSNLKTLRVNRACLGKPLFEKLLECCPKLESFTCRHPLSAYGAQRDADDDEHRRPPLSPELMETVLKNAKYTLKQLNIVRPKHPVTAHDESRLDLSDWTALERISIPSHYFVAPFKYNSDRNGFYKLLPVSLKALSIVWDTSGLFFYRRMNWGNIERFSEAFEADEAKWEQEHGDNGIVRDKYLWILELALNKRICFPGLTHVEMTDIPGWDYEMKPWNGGKALRSIFVEEGIELVVEYLGNFVGGMVETLNSASGFAI